MPEIQKRHPSRWPVEEISETCHLSGMDQARKPEERNDRRRGTVQDKFLNGLNRKERRTERAC